MNVSDLKRSLRGAVYQDSDTLKELAKDFGGIIEAVPAAAVVPEEVEDVEVSLQWANRTGAHVVIRGGGRSQGGQTLLENGVVLDVSSLNRIETLQQDQVWVESGVRWGTLIDRLTSQGRIPISQPADLASSVGGSIAGAGLGPTAFRLDAGQRDCILALDVVTGGGERVICSPRLNQDLFHSVRGGLGHFGVILRARLQLRRQAPHFTTHLLVYDQLKELLGDAEELMNREETLLLAGECLPLSVGYRILEEVRMPVSEWFYVLRVTSPGDEQPLDTQGLKKLRQETVCETQLPQLVAPAEPDEWDLGVSSIGGQHPWVELLLPWHNALDYITAVLKNLPPVWLSRGRFLLWPLSSKALDCASLIRPPGSRVLGFSLRCPLVSGVGSPLLSYLEKAGRLAIQVGGKRHPAGWWNNTAADWKRHYGDRLERLRQQRRFFDPGGVLGFGRADGEDGALFT